MVYMNIKDLYDLSKKYVENLGYEMPDFKEFKEYKITDECDELKTECITDDDGFLIDEYNYLKTENYLVDSGIYFKKEKNEIIDGKFEKCEKKNIFSINISKINLELSVFYEEIYDFNDEFEAYVSKHLFKNFNLSDELFKKLEGEKQNGKI